jgi:D-beta-D-heptose 7-phosphate kinase/D-beta-D-heptose 1-phosphate adenosyltransferase
VNPAPILSLEEARRQVAHWKAAGERVVFTNGCFDWLHPGHLHLLREAASLGDRLVVGINTDASVQRLKGELRPVVPLEERAALLAAVRWVSLVVPFEEDTPERVIQALTPDVLVKGADYTEAEVVGASWVRAHGGEVVLVPLVEGMSTSKRLRTLRERLCGAWHGPD